MRREVFFPFPILSGLVNAMFWLRGLRERGEQSAGKADPAASPQFGSSASSRLLHRKLAGAGESIPSLCTPAIKHPESFGFLLPGENSSHCTPGE